MKQSLFLSLADCLRKWAPRIAGPDPGDPEVERLLATYISWLEKCSHYMSEKAWSEHLWTRHVGRGGRWLKDLGMHCELNAEALCQCLVFSFHINNTSTAMSLILRRAFRCAPPEILGFVEHVLTRVALPSPSTLSRARFYADVAFMITWRDKHMAFVTGGALLIGLLDSSPHGGRIF